MGLREFKLPADAQLLVDLIPPMFQYPDHPEWSFQQDEVANILDTFKNIKRMWPIMPLLSIPMPFVRNVMRGYVWEEAGRPVGLANTGQSNPSPRWFIGNVGVLPEYRRQGIARKLVVACVDLSKKLGASNVQLDVIAANAPARKLYEDLGFELFQEHIDLDCTRTELPDAVPLLPNYTLRPLSEFEGGSAFALAKRIRPAAVQRYNPVEWRDFHVPILLRPLINVLNSSQKRERYAVLHDGQVVAIGRYSARLKPGGFNTIGIQLDPAHAALASYLVRDLTRKTIQASPGRRIGFSAVSWQTGLCEAATEAGYALRHETLQMGLAF